MEFLPTSYVEEYVAMRPNPLNELGEFVYSRTYSRWLEDKSRREYWHETVKRAIEYNMALEYKHLKKIGYSIHLKQMREEAKELFESIYNTKQFPSGRTLWLGNANEKVNKNFALGNFNCSFLSIETWEDLGELFYLLLVGTGVGFKSRKKMAEKMDPIRTNTTLLHSQYRPVTMEQRLEHTQTVKMENGFAKIYVGDSKEGWVESLTQYLDLLTKKENEDIHTIKISYNSVRPEGERLKTFGGTASGPSPLQEMFEGINKVLKNEIDPHLDPIEIDEKGYGKVRPVHILDIGNLIGANVVVGGVRRTAEIFLFDADDQESMFAKYGMNGIWTEEQLEHHKNIGKLLEKADMKPRWFDNLNAVGDRREGLDHRRMSNNSIAFETKPSRDFLHLVFEMMQLEGEPGFFNMEEARRRRPNAEGVNPCGEIILDSKGVCNLTTINVKAFVQENEDGTNSLDLEGLKRAQELSARIGLRMTLTPLEIDSWNDIQQRDRLIGTSVTGWKDALALVNGTEEDEVKWMNELRDASRNAADAYAKALRVNAPLLATTVKPEGTLSQVAGGVSPGVHMSHSPYYIRRVRINATDPLVKVAKELGWKIHAEIGTNGVYDQNELAKEAVITEARTVIFDFPVASGSKRTKEDTTVDEQFDTYFRFQKEYVEHNASNTIDVKPGEWHQAEQRVWDGWDNFVGVSFLSHDGGTYTLAPYEACTKEEYEQLKASMKPFDAALLHQFEQSETKADLETMESCSSGVCPIR
ncbi:ribonucleoside-triphosphate reductase, adenosylcobalamin-dependent [Alkalibacterium sp. 20]|uniref:ribonucleoside-triphosphate reductase, adenosylcobalamin-dependent n=1 Tax=Alkalibacterium sp. 20 TaxID=1798803 RepID=UPI0009001182|nr:ribonucleoside-triphosphate reductase, adenosylcobalamin-dependent [Alkalibacterium sp. 20]OJF95940.1 ribonucleoside-triphosphate reductase [Alkalibacterium sp. 20]